ncbi:FKBP-type peptidyl-prolyl cis-trans isomerase N-terminal domain-containing protein [Dryocola sp. LX212]|jgi:FKBP-type peptidyl-prolyl cis-trans isomerase
MNVLGKLKPTSFSLSAILTGLLIVSCAVVAQEDDALVSITSQINDDNAIPAILNYARNNNIHDATETKPVEKKKKPLVRQNPSAQPGKRENSQQGWLTRKDEKINQLQAQLENKSAAAEVALKKEQVLLAKISRLQASLDELMADKIKIANQLEETKAHLSQNKEGLQASINAVMAEKQKLAVELEAIKNQSGKEKENLQTSFNAVTAEKQKLAAELETIKNQSGKEKETLQKSLNTAMAEKQKLAAELEIIKNQSGKEKETLQESLNTAMAEKQKLAADLETLNSLFAREKEALKVETNSVATLTAKLAELQKIAGSHPPKLDLDKIPQQQAYSVGVSLGDDVLQELLTREIQGVKMDRVAVLKGIEDVFADNVALDEQTRKKALLAATEEVFNNLNKLEKQALNEGKKYLEKFKKQKNVQFKEGVYSRIDYAGKGEIKPDDTVTVVMKETLTDGTVVSDMEVAGKVWSQPLSDYPAIFRAPLERLEDHGSVTIVVPPELAYGSKGVPPKIPPGSTMTYSVRIVEVGKKK